MLTGGPMEIKQANDSLTIRLTPQQVDLMDSIVVLTVDGLAQDIPVIDSLTSEHHLTIASGDASSSITGKNSLEMLIGSDKGNFVEGKTHRAWWAARKDDKQPWIVLDFGTESTFDYVTLSEQIRNCSTRKFVIEYEVSGEWKKLYEGEQIGMDFCLKTPKTKAQKIRIRFLENAFGQKPNILKINVYNL